MASELDTIRAAGGTFAYPDALTPYEWTCLTALQAGRTESESNSFRDRQAQTNEAQQRANLEQARRRAR